MTAGHTAGIVTPDLTPDNFMVTRDGRAKILDFGLARQRARVTPEDTRDPHLYCRIAIHAPNPAAFGLGRMYEQLSGDNRHVSVFSDREQALAWLLAT
jgi:serine/threonine protein kinase